MLKMFYFALITVSCGHEGIVRLFGNIYQHRGYVQVCLNGTWGSVCGIRWNSLNIAAGVVCKQLGYSRFTRKY